MDLSNSYLLVLCSDSWPEQNLFKCGFSGLGTVVHWVQTDVVLLMLELCLLTPTGHNFMAILTFFM